MIEKMLLDNFKELYEKQDVLSVLTNRSLYTAYGYSQIHCIEAIGKIAEANVTKISAHMKITKSAVSKITKYLMKQGCIVSYKKVENKKEVYFALTEKGNKVYMQHEHAHAIWMQRDIAFLSSLDEEEKQGTLRTLEKFNTYLKQKIEEDSPCL